MESNSIRKKLIKPKVNNAKVIEMTGENRTFLSENLKKSPDEFEESYFCWCEFLRKFGGKMRVRKKLNRVNLKLKP